MSSKFNLKEHTNMQIRDYKYYIPQNFVLILELIVFTIYL